MQDQRRDTSAAIDIKKRRAKLRGTALVNAALKSLGTSKEEENPDARPNPDKRQKTSQ